MFYALAYVGIATTTFFISRAGRRDNIGNAIVAVAWPVTLPVMLIGIGFKVYRRTAKP